MTKEFIPYEQALELKELGFNEQCFAYYDCERDLIVVRGKTKFLTCEFAVPLYQQAFRWFREKHDLHCYVEKEKLYDAIVDFDYIDSYNTYEEAELACLKKLIEIVKNK